MGTNEGAGSLTLELTPGTAVELSAALVARRAEIDEGMRDLLLRILAGHAVGRRARPRQLQVLRLYARNRSELRRLDVRAGEALGWSHRMTG